MGPNRLHLHREITGQPLKKNKSRARKWPRGILELEKQIQQNIANESSLITEIPKERTSRFFIFNCWDTEMLARAYPTNTNRIIWAGKLWPLASPPPRILIQMTKQTTTRLQCLPLTEKNWMKNFLNQSPLLFTTYGLSARDSLKCHYFRLLSKTCYLIPWRDRGQNKTVL